MTEIFAAVIGAVVGSVLSWWLTRRVSYPQGIEQGKRLALHEKSVEVLTELRKRLLALRTEWAAQVDGLPDEDESRSNSLLSKQKSLEDFYEENKLVLNDETQEKVEAIIANIDRKRESFYTGLLMSSLGDDEDKHLDRRYRTGAEALKWLEHEFPKFLKDLDLHIRRITGADEDHL